MGVCEYTPTSLSYEGNNRGKREAPTCTGQEHATRETKTTKVNSIMWLHHYSILKHHNDNHHYDYYRTISKIISGILTMVYSAVNHGLHRNDFPPPDPTWVGFFCVSHE